MHQFKFAVIAHRGASKVAPENTLSSVRKALELSSDYVEVDVHLTQDEVPVVIHDSFPERTTNSKSGKRVTEMTLAELKTLDAGSWFSSAYSGEQIPTLEEILNIKRTPSGLMIEIKKGHAHSKPLVHSICKLISQHSDRDDIVVGSFSPNIIEEIQRHYPHLSLIGIAEDFNMVSLLQAKRLPKVALWYKLITPDLVRNLHDVNTKVWAFTVDDLNVAEFLLSIHIDGLITNDPVLMLGLKQQI